MLEKVRQGNSKLMKSNLKVLCSIRQLDYKIMHLRAQLRDLHTIMARVGLSVTGSAADPSQDLDEKSGVSSQRGIPNSDSEDESNSNDGESTSDSSD